MLTVHCSGFAKGTDMSPDLLHTYLGLSGLSLAEPPLLPSLNPVDPALNITLRAKQHLLSLHKQWKSWFKIKCFLYWHWFYFIFKVFAPLPPSQEQVFIFGFLGPQLSIYSLHIKHYQLSNIGFIEKAKDEKTSNYLTIKNTWL